jgi:hypothetical protein
VLETIEVTTDNLQGIILANPIATFAGIILAASIAFPANAQTVTIPAEVRGQPGRLLPIAITHDGEDVAWYVPPTIDAFREYSSDPKDVRLRLQCWTPGKYEVIAQSCKGGKMSGFKACSVIIEGNNPTPPPNPPTPIPPGPFPPPNPPPIPDDPVARRLRDAYSTDRGTVTEKHEAKRLLSGFFEAMAGHVKDPSVKTVGDLLGDYRAAIPSVLKPGVLDAVRRQTAREIADIVGDDAGRQIDPELREKLIKLFEFLAFILKLLV